MVGIDKKHLTPYSITGEKDQDEKLLLPYTYFLPGEDITGEMIDAFNVWLKIPDDKLRTIKQILELTETAFLIIDDIEDNAIRRRGIPVAHSVYGVGCTVNAANYAYIIALEKALSLNHPDACKVYCEQLLEIRRGQAIEVYWTDKFTCPSLKEYKRMIRQKTAGLFMLALRLMQLFSDNRSDFEKFITLLGICFQICDDYCDLCIREFSGSYFEDLSEGKFTLPTIHAIQNEQDNDHVSLILRQRTRSIDLKQYCVQLLDKHGSTNYTKESLLAADKEAREEIRKLGQNKPMEEIFNKYCIRTIS